MKPLKILLSCLVATILTATSCTNAHDDKYKLLDEAVEKRDEYKVKREKVISDLKNELRQGDISDDTKYQINNQIFNEYLAFKADSANKYSDVLCQLANSLHNTEYINESAINKAALFATSGLFDKAEDILNSLDKSTFTTANYQLYYENRRWLYITWSTYLSGNEIKAHYDSLQVAYGDSMITVVPHNDVDYYYWMGEHYWRHHQYKEAERMYMMGIERMSPLSRRYASITCAMALVCHEQERFDEFEKYMIMAAIADQKIALKENLAMQELSLFLTTHRQDMERANRYLKCSLEDAIFYNNRLRLTQVARKFPDVVGKYQEYDARLGTLKTVIIGAFTILVVLLLILVWYGVRNNRDLKAQRRIRIQLISDLTAANDNLNSLSQDLKSKNMQLQETNTLREQYVSLFIELCAAYIDKYNKFHKAIERKVKVHQVDDLLTMLHQNRTKDVDTREFFMNFDKAFLALYPNFVQDFNQLLNPDQRVNLKNGEIMSNELRIMALMRLGVTDTQKISTLLFYSPQTIYNYRSVFKQKALDPENFDSSIMQCG